MRTCREAAVAAAITLVILLLWATNMESWQAQATSVNCFASGSTPNCPVVETEQTLVGDSSNPQFVLTSGYVSAGDGGGGVLYSLQNTGPCTPPRISTPRGRFRTVVNLWLRATLIK